MAFRVGRLRVATGAAAARGRDGGGLSCVRDCARVEADAGREPPSAEPGTDQRGDREMNVPCPPVVVAVVRVGQLD